MRGINCEYARDERMSKLGVCVQIIHWHVDVTFFHEDVITAG